MKLPNARMDCSVYNVTASSMSRVAAATSQTINGQHEHACCYVAVKFEQLEYGQMFGNLSYTKEYLFGAPQLLGVQGTHRLLLLLHYSIIIEKGVYR